MGGQKQSYPQVVIVGAGLSGICMGIQLKRAGIDSFTILEKSQEVGGTWLDNSYPGCGCDVPAMLYSFSFAIKKDWSRKYALQPELFAYFRDCADRFKLREHLKFGVEVESAKYDHATGKWEIVLTSGEKLTTDIFISALGQLNRPSIPKLEGLDSFQGETFHSARWNHNFDFKNKTVAVVGNGASAIQFFPEISKQTRRTYVIQRTPNYISPRDDYAYSHFIKTCFDYLPGAARIYRAVQFWKHESRISFYKKNSSLNKTFRHKLIRRMQNRLPQELWKQVIPEYPAGCKRVLLSDNYLESLARENVTLIPHGVQKVTPTGLVAGEQKIEVDAIIFATGFQSTQFLSPLKIVGKQGIEIHEAWKIRPKTYLGVMANGFPNFFMLYGPNTNLGHNSICFMIESQTKMILNCLKLLKQKKAQSIEVKSQAVEKFDLKLQKDLDQLVWTGDCNNWYKNESGNIVNNWSGSLLRYYWKTRKLDKNAFQLQNASE